MMKLFEEGNCDNCHCYGKVRILTCDLGEIHFYCENCYDKKEGERKDGITKRTKQMSTEV
jgi:hypothetical protein